MKQRILDTLKMMGVCFAVIVFFAFLAASCEDKEDRAERSVALEEMREQIWDEAYQAGYEDGYDAACYDLSVRSLPIIDLVSPQSSAEDITVYVSRSFLIHKKSNCSGMKVYTEMTLAQAESFGYEKCKKCWK